MTTGLALPAIIIVAVLLALPVLVVRRQWPLAVGLFAAGAGVGVQSPPIYAAVDPVLGGQNLTNLVYHLLTVTGIGAFLSVVVSAKPSLDLRRARHVVSAVTAVACLLEVVLFVIGWRTAGWGRADGHLAAKLTTPLFLMYASMLWIGLAALAVVTIAAVRSQTSGRPWSVAKVGTGLVAAGAIAALGWCANAAARAIAAVELVRDPGATDPIGQLLALVAGIGVFAGLAVINVPHLIASGHHLWLRLSTRRLWLRAAGAAPEVVLRPGRAGWLSGRATLYRRWVEIEDAIRLGRVELTAYEREQVNSMERIFAPTAAEAASITAVGRA